MKRTGIFQCWGVCFVTIGLPICPLFGADNPTEPMPIPRWTSPESVSLATQGGPTPAFVRNSTFDIADQKGASAKLAVRMVFEPSTGLLLAGLPYDRYVVAGERMIGLSLLPGNILHFAVSTTRIPGAQKADAPPVIQALAGFLQKATANPHSENHRLRLRKILGAFDFGDSLDASLPPTPKIVDVQIAAHGISIVLESVSKSKAALTLNERMECIAASIDGVPVALPQGSLKPDE